MAAFAMASVMLWLAGAFALAFLAVTAIQSSVHKGQPALDLPSELLLATHGIHHPCTRGLQLVDELPVSASSLQAHD